MGSRDALAELLSATEEELRKRELQWKPFADKPDGTPHPQRLALESKADVLGYGGAAGGGKSDLLLGLAGWMHYRSVIFRRVFPSLRGMIDRSRQIYNPENMGASNDSYNESLYRWRFPDRGGAQLRFGSLQYERDVLAWQGQPHDLYGFDELTEFTEYQFRYVTGWNRTARPGQRCRVVGTMNPPTTKEGEWVIRYFAPWLDDTHPNPAKPGELRWYTMLNGKEVEVDEEWRGTDDHGNEIIPRSRTFIFAAVYDNPVLVASGYVATLQSLPEPLRSKMLLGDFKAGIEEDPWQVFPSEWIKLAQARWREREEPATKPQQIGVDVARGGGDRTVLTPRKDNYFCEQICIPGSQTKRGADVIGACVPLCGPDTSINIDVIGVGTSPHDIAEMNKMNIVAMNGSEKTEARSKAGNLGFYNRRAEWHWKLREDLDPTSGQELAIPDDPEILADLCAIKWELTPRGIKVRDKDETKQIIGRSPDKGESLIYAHGSLTRSAAGLLEWMKSEVAEREAQRKAA